MNAKQILIALIFIILPTISVAQSDEYVPNEKPLDFRRTISISYAVATPVARMSKHFSPWSYSGIVGRYCSYARHNLTVGVGMSWISFYGYDDRATQYFPGGAVTAEAMRFYNNFSATINSHYSLIYERNYRIFAGADAGLYYNSTELRLGHLVKQDDQWTIGISPELGAMRSISKSDRIVLQAVFRYTIVPFYTEWFNTAQYLSLDCGLMLRL